jgi:superfamily II DNA helicase RecQ
LAEYLNGKFNQEVCGFYHAKMERDERREVLDAWKSGNIEVLVATSALGAGLDHGVRLVIHHGFAKSLIDFGQESGRGGRDGKAAKYVAVF